jgi:hypothetical protein
MANNFKLIGDIYVSKEGNDANSGLTPDLPKLTVQAALNLATTGNKTIIIGSGVYAEAITKSNTGLARLSILGDGTVVMNGINSINSFTITNIVSGGSVYISNIRFISYSILSFSPIVNTPTTVTFENCVVSSNLIINAISSINSLQAMVLKKCILLNLYLLTNNASNNLVATNGQFHIYDSILINCNSNGLSLNYAPFSCQIFLNNYLDKTSLISTLATITAANFNFNNIQGKIMMNTGVYAGIALSFADHRTFYPTFNVQSISTDPLFNNAENLDFTLQAASPHIKAASDYISNIGGTEYAKHYKANSTEFTSGATITDLTLRGDNSYTITSPATEGRIITAPLAVQSYPATKPLTGIIWNGSLEFNKSLTAGTQGNQNVPAWDTYTTGAGANPDRLKIKMRYSTQSASPSVGEWDNDGYWAADTYQLVEVNMKPKVDSNGVGNGDQTYIEFTGLGDLVPTWIQLDIKLRNDYNI